MEKNITDGADLEVNLPPGISEDGLKIFVSFLYDGVLNLNEHLYKDVERISNLLKVDKIQKHCREFAASLNEHKQMTSSPLTLTPRRRDSLPKSHKQSNRQTVVLTLSDDSNPADVTFENQEQNVGLSHAHLEEVHNSLLDERIQSLNEQHNYLTSHQNQFPSTSQASSMSLQGSSSVSAITSECGIKTEPIEILDDDVTDYNLSQEDIKQCKPSISQSGKGYSDDTSNSEPHRRSSQGHISSKVTRTYMTPSKCESGIELAPLESISTCATTGASPYPVSLVASSGETFPLYTLSSTQSWHCLKFVKQVQKYIFYLHQSIDYVIFLGIFVMSTKCDLAVKDVLSECVCVWEREYVYVRIGVGERMEKVLTVSTSLVSPKMFGAASRQKC